LLVDGNGNSYNEGIRVLPASNGWSNMYFAAAKTKTVKDSEGKDVVVVNEAGTEVSGWLIGRRGANGSVKVQSNVTGGTIVAKAGDFTIEENSSSGTNLTIHKNTTHNDGTITYGGATLMGPFTAGQFKSDYTATSMSISDNNEISFGSNANYIYFGYDNRTGSNQRVTTYIFG
jgi:hypothetical protein